LLAADIAIESFSPGQRRRPIQRSGFLHQGSLHRTRYATRSILCHFAARKELKITKFHRRCSDCGLLHSRPQESTKLFLDSFIRMQQRSARIRQQSRGEKPKFLGCISTIDDYYGCPRFPGVPAT
jgi:hypothetical protein